MPDQTATVLCVDDEEPALFVRKLLLESAGYRVLTATSGKEGLRIFRSEPVDLVLLDYWMSGMNGLTAAREIKQINQKIPIIVLSAFNTILDESVGTVDRWIRKGEEDPPHLLAVIGQMLNRSRAVSASASAPRDEVAD